MQGINHAVLGTAGGFIVGTYVEAPITTRVAMGLVGAFGGLFPDIDTKSSLLGRFLPNFWHKLTPGHRRFTHSLLFSALTFACAIAVQWFGCTVGLWHTPVLPYIPIALLAGVLTHLFADGLTVVGIPLLYPFIKHRFRLIGRLSFRTGDQHESVAVTFLLALGAAYVLMPWTAPLGDLIEMPLVFSIQPGKIIVFVATLVACAAVLTIYKLSIPRRSRRRRPPSPPPASRKNSSRRPPPSRQRISRRR